MPGGFLSPSRLILIYISFHLVINIGESMMHDLFVYITMPLGDYLGPGLPYPFLRKAWDWGKWKREWERQLGRRRKEEKERDEGGREEGGGSKRGRNLPNFDPEASTTTCMYLIGSSS